MTRFFSLLLYFLPVIYLFIVFFSFVSGRIHSAYDEWRILELFLLFLSFVCYGALQKRTFFISHKFLIVAAVFFVMTSVSMLQAQDVRLAMLDFLLITSLVCYIYISFDLSRSMTGTSVDMPAAVISLFPVYTVLWFWVGYTLHGLSDLTTAWHGLFTNIRCYNDTLLPCLFLLWYRPSFLKVRRALVVLVSSMYLLTLWIDAARAVWLSLVFGLLVAALLKKDSRNILLPLVSIAISFVLYQLLLFFEPKTVTYTVARYSSSGRWVMWLGSWQAWLDNLVFGIGGANFVLIDHEINPQGLGHPHNLIVQLVLEWGGAGVLAVVLMLRWCWRYLKPNYTKVPTMLLAGLFAIMLNVLLSGAYIYPESQVAMLFFLMVSFFKTPTQTSQNKLINSGVRISLNPALVGSIAVLLIAVLALDGFDDYVKDYEQRSYGPRFWLNAYSITPELAN